MKTRRILATTAVAALVGVWGFAGTLTGQSGQAAAAGQKVDNFELTDQNLHAQNLYLLADAKAVVFITQANGDAAVRANAGAYNALKAAYKDKGVEFFMLNANPADTREAVLKEAADYHYDFQILQDTYQLVGEQMGLDRTAEVIVIDPKSWNIVFRGPVDDRVSGERTKATATKTYANDALDSLLAGRPITTARVAAPGARIALTAATQHDKVTYSKDIAPLIQAKCTGCHQPGSIGPMNLVNYDDIRGHAPMIREVIRTKRMPPFHADPRIGTFHNDKSLSADQIRMLVHWIEAGAPRGDGADPLGAQTFQAPEWPLGKPDVVLNIPAFTIPATGVVDYKAPWVAMPAGLGDRWLRASTVKVGQRQGLHHVLTHYLANVPTNGDPTKGGGGQGVSVGGYAVGSESSLMPADSGTLVPAGGAIGFQMHYTPFGREAVDDTKLGLYFYDKGKEPTYVMHNSVIMDTALRIPANDGAWQDTSYMTFPNDATLFSAFPHAHYRAVSTSLEIMYPDGKRQMLLALPHYDFNWQGAYVFEHPIDIPAGSKLVAHYTYDNSKRNPANPDPNRTVTWGEQSFEEMFFMSYAYQWKGETAAHRVNYDTALNASRGFGMIDKNLSGKIEVAELNGSQAALRPMFGMLDRNGDGGLDAAEFAGIAAARAGAGRASAAPQPEASNPARPQG